MGGPDGALVGTVLVADGLDDLNVMSPKYLDEPSECTSSRQSS